ncbi:hypothetical protein CkaCkLH20_09625 [Colletotrichum karsti]|uniref:Uncharacterized protein n=1 Tax=Colletotrichum karsti TaxID=1095194 RepID=A0A9P6LHN5_9PEZI|nr:uncharacterized protein CkaCkLH20_09625 [Colletotrichum karsti]KAF9872762.1 hypothetical protein CkaCkLH20_09625 [Colletotrichum karsti]
MRFSTIITLLAASYATAMPVDAKDGDGKGGKGGDIAACETKAAADQVACINGCAKDAACITACTSVAVKEYTSCAGV